MSPGPAFYERLEAIGLDHPACRMFDSRRQHSLARLSELSRRLKHLPPVVEYPDLAIYAAGSHARGEASVYSDIDLWFLRDDVSSPAELETPNIRSICLMSSVIGEMKDMEFPSPSNDGEYLKILSLQEVLQHLGGPQDDYMNHFTARMLLILESRPVYGSDVYGTALEKIMESYMRDYEDHAEDFRPTFLVNDITDTGNTLSQLRASQE